MIAGTRHTKDFSGTPEGKAAATKLSDYWAKLQLEAKTKKSRTNVLSRDGQRLRGICLCRSYDKTGMPRFAFNYYVRKGVADEALTARGAVHITEMRPFGKAFREAVKNILSHLDVPNTKELGILIDRTEITLAKQYRKKGGAL